MEPDSQVRLTSRSHLQSKGSWQLPRLRSDRDGQGVMASQWSTMGSILISAGEDFTVRMWDVTRGPTMLSIYSV